MGSLKYRFKPTQMCIVQIIKSTTDKKILTLRSIFYKTLKSYKPKIIVEKILDFLDSRNSISNFFKQVLRHRHS